MLIILWAIWSIIWYLVYARNFLNINREILKDLCILAPIIESSEKFMDFKLGSIFNLFLIVIVLVVKHFFHTVGFILQVLYLVYSFTGILVYFKRWRAYKWFISDTDDYALKKTYKNAILPYFFSNALYIFYTFYLYVLSHYLSSIW